MLNIDYFSVIFCEAYKRELEKFFQHDKFEPGAQNVSMAEGASFIITKDWPTFVERAMT